jgi:hypothetical protein
MSRSHSHSRAGERVADVAEVIGPVPTFRPGAVARPAGAYGSVVPDLFPPRRPLDPGLFDGLCQADVLKHYLGMVRAWRKTERPQRFRADDLRTLVSILGTDGAQIEAKLRALTGCSRQTARWFRRLFVLGLAASSGALLYQGVAAAAGDNAGQSHLAPAVSAGVAAPGPALPAPVVCHRPSVTSAPVPSGSSRPGAVVKVSVTVMAYVDVQLDSAGAPVAVRTNTGNAPDCEAPWYVLGPQDVSGGAPAKTAVINQVMDAVAGMATLPGPGGWLPGTWYDL